MSKLCCVQIGNGFAELIIEGITDVITELRRMIERKEKAVKKAVSSIAPYVDYCSSSVTDEPLVCYPTS